MASKDDERRAKVQAALAKALAGDEASLRWLQDAVGPSSQHPAATRTAARAALATYAAQKPAIVVRPALAATENSLVQPVLHPAHKFTPHPILLPTMKVPGAEPATIGFTPVDPNLEAPPVVSTITVKGVAPRIIQPIHIGAANGGVITGPPQAEYSGPMSSSLDAPNYGFVPPETTAPAPPSIAAAPVDSKTLLLLLAAVAVFFLVDSKRK